MVLPEVFTKVLEVKKLIAQKGEKSSASACKRVGISRSAYYKYKDSVFSYEELFNRIAAMTVYKDDPNISQKYRIPDCIEIEEFTSLAESIFIGISPIIPINMALAQLMNTEFWKGNNIRIRRKKVDYFFCPKS